MLLIAISVLLINFSFFEAFLISLFEKDYCKVLPVIADQYLLPYTAVIINIALLHILFYYGFFQSTSVTQLRK